MVSLLPTLSTVLSCGPAVQGNGIAAKPALTSQVSGTASDKAEAQGFVQRLVMQISLTS
ncbi:hypothetical protein KIN20_021062 [Parelaphostrongylus tenuis]|uniref:Uncharacterized protein n=1 Tax=Parelaphostrongylus tenuis TaxID=148309 RepID=A0AAD5N4U1_PARTN|nr:hypothetical protein KIN20_021062 [Parelaphostrongylus tenuis]